MEVVIDINWDELTKEKYLEVEGKIKDFEDDYIGCIRVGEICVDVVVRNYRYKIGYVYSLDPYVANEDTGYAYKGPDRLPYDQVDGTYLKDQNLSYEEFVLTVNAAIEKFIKEHDTENGYSLVEKANKPLLVW